MGSMFGVKNESSVVQEAPFLQLFMVVDGLCYGIVFLPIQKELWEGQIIVRFSMKNSQKNAPKLFQLNISSENLFGIILLIPGLANNVCKLFIVQSRTPEISVLFFIYSLKKLNLLNVSLPCNE